MSPRDINFGSSESDAKYQISDDGTPGDFVLARDTNGATVLLKWNATNGAWEYGGPVDLDGNDLLDAGTTVYDASADTVGDGTTSADHSAVETGTLENAGSPITVNERLDISGHNLRLATGQAIEDDGGTSRLSIGSSSTSLDSDSGNVGFVANDGIANVIFARNGEQARIFDDYGAFTAVDYNAASTAPGTLELTNARLKWVSDESNTTGDSMTANPESDTEDGYVEINVQGTVVQVPFYNA